MPKQEQVAIYLTREQLRALYALTFDQRNVGDEPSVGLEIRGDGDGYSPVSAVAVLRDRPHSLGFATIDKNGETDGWER